MADPLIENYPHHQWDRSKMENRYFPLRASQRILAEGIRNLFPTWTVYEEYFPEELKYPSGEKMQVDVFVPDHGLVFEYQGEQHYGDVFAHGAHWRYREKDQIKRQACDKCGLTLIEIPYWWDYDLDDLKFTIHFSRPDLLSKPQKGKLISASSDHIVHNQETSLRHGIHWDHKSDLTGWYLSQKMAGIRCFWDGNKLWSQSGKEIKTPPFFVTNLGNIPLDGELYSKEGDNKKTRGVLDAFNGHWESVKYHVFDLPKSNRMYRERIALLQEMKFPPHVKTVSTVYCNGEEHILQYLSEIINHGGEGLMANDPKSFYIPGTVDSFVYIKQVHQEEVKVLEILNKGMNCQQSNGQVIFVEYVEGVLKSPPAVGSMIVINHAGYFKNGKMKHPFYKTKVDSEVGI
eukprot:TRINITY_DN5530_c0_g1_i2.p1 TRINITY_DN5530_c0_g1~~TRINITY_DN5530_c0_g1_i2.p1  ORF type:complete len:403 (-),score=77.54 TRINITY_DN5530_c0_g1_i2:67-1275(-)